MNTQPPQQSPDEPTQPGISPFQPPLGDHSILGANHSLVIQFLSLPTGRSREKSPCFPNQPCSLTLFWNGLLTVKCAPFFNRSSVVRQSAYRTCYCRDTRLAGTDQAVPGSGPGRDLGEGGQLFGKECAARLHQKLLRRTLGPRSVGTGRPDLPREPGNPAPVLASIPRPVRGVATPYRRFSHAGDEHQPAHPTAIALSAAA